MDRRDLLRTGSAALATGIGGCLGWLDDGQARRRSTARTPSGTPTPAGPADLGNPSLDVASDPRVGRPVDLTVSVTNTGGEPGSFSDTLRIRGPGTARTAVEIDDVEPGKRGSTTATVTPEYAGTYTAELVSGAARLEFNVHPVDSVGATVAIDDATEFTLRGIGIESSIFLEGSARDYLQDPEIGLLGSYLRNDSQDYVLVIKGTVRNTGETRVTFDHSKIGLRTAGGKGPSVHDVGTTPTRVPFEGASATLDGEELTGKEIPAGESVDGFILAPLNRRDAERAITIRVHRDDDKLPEAEWKFEPEDGTRKLPRFEVKKLSVPDEVEIGGTVEFSVEVTNTGAIAGTFRGVLQDHLYRRDWMTLATVEGTLKYSQTKTFTNEMEFPWIGEHAVRFRPSGKSKTVVGQKARRGFGEFYEMPNGVTVKIEYPQYSDGLEYGEEKWSNNVLTVRATAELPERAMGTKNTQISLPPLEEFKSRFQDDSTPLTPTLRTASDSAQMDAKHNNNHITHPIQGDLYPMTPPKDPENGQIQGWMSFPIGREHLPKKQMQVHLRKTYIGRTTGVVAAWSRQFDE